MRKHDFAKCDRIDTCTEAVCPLGRHSCLTHSVCAEGRNYKKRNKEPAISKREQIAEPEAVEESGYFEEAEETVEVKPAKAKVYRRIHCQICNSLFVPKSNRAKYCKVCGKKMERKNHAKRQRKYSSS